MNFVLRFQTLSQRRQQHLVYKALLDKLVVEWSQRLLVPRTHWNLLRLGKSWNNLQNSLQIQNVIMQFQSSCSFNSKVQCNCYC